LKKASNLVVENKPEDAQFIETRLRGLFGNATVITVAATVAAMVQALRGQTYSVVILDDKMDADKKAEDTLPLLAASGHTGPVILMSGLLTRARVAELHRLGATEIIAKDDIVSVALGAVILKVLDPGK
jgi:DNA-binding NtrC family response regulator